MNRRDFIAAIGAAGAVGVARALSPLGSVPDTSLCSNAKAALSPDDLSFLGVLKVPREVLINSGNNAGTLAGRVVNGQTRLFMQQGRLEGAGVVEFTDSGVYAPTVADAVRADVVRVWGDIYGGKRVKQDGTPLSARLDTQIFWDEATGCLFWSYIDAYATLGNGAAAHPCIGASRLRADGTVETFGPWQTSEPVHKMIRAFMRAPQAFADAHLGGRSFIAGCIGTESGNSASSWGPAAFALTPEPGPGTPNWQAAAPLVATPLVGYSIENRCPRSSDYLAHGSPDIAGGWWTQMDGYHGTGCWIDLPDKHALAFFQSKAQGHVWYGVGSDCGHGLSVPQETTGPHSTASEPTIYLYNPDDCVPVLQGAVESHALVPITGSLRAIGGSFSPSPAENFMNGCWFNPATRRLYVVNWQRDQVGCCLHYPIINVYEVQ